MIIDIFISAITGMVKLVLGILPTIPATPTAVVSGGQWILDTIGGVMGILNMIYTPALSAAIIVIAVALFNFEWLYHGVMWVLKKIPVINIK